MLSYKHFTLEERKYLQELLSEGKKLREIAAFLGRSPSSISREINRNKAKYKPHNPSNNKFWYSSWRAETLSIMRRRKSTHHRLKKDSEEYLYIIEKLKSFWTPEQISNRWRIENPEKKIFGVSTVYRDIKKGLFPQISRKTHLRRRGKHMLPRSSNYNTIKPDRTIPQWSNEIKERLRVGDWEGDTVYGGVGKGLIVTLVDRKSRYLKTGLLNKRDSELTKNIIISLLHTSPVKSISLDNGSEFSKFRELEKGLNTNVYFAEPHKPWQRGTNENTNDIIRFFFPKGFDFHSITQDDLNFVVNLINNRPRKCLGWHTPAEIFYSQGVALG